MKKRAAAKPDCIRGGCASWPVKASLRHQYTKKIGLLFRKPGFSAAAGADRADIQAAADKLYLTHQGLSRVIRSLEEELGVQLLVRSRRGCVPTAWGVRIYEDCKSLLAELAAKIASWKKPDTGEGEPVFVPVVAIPSACNYLTEHVFSSMKQAIPLVDVVLHEAVVYELSSFLQQGKAHVGVTAFSEGEAERLIMQYREMGFVSEPLMEDEYYVFISSRHPLASKASLTVQDCSTLKLATYSNQMLERNQLFQKKIFEVIGMTQYVYVNSRENIMQMVAQNLRVLCATRERMRQMEAKQATVEERIEEIRLVNRAKWLLIECLGMTEPEAHRYIEKQSMDQRISKREVAESVIRTYK